MDISHQSQQYQAHYQLKKALSRWTVKQPAQRRLLPVLSPHPPQLVGLFPAGGQRGLYPIFRMQTGKYLDMNEYKSQEQK